jgi:predicted 3-demethylubiquinone-9 3-methyltransferase (glyoxalase superfamily)
MRAENRKWKPIKPFIKQRLAPCLWFDTQAEDAANHYASIFRNSRIKQISRYGKAGREAGGVAR